MDNANAKAVTPRKIGITETVLRDGHQSRMATRMRTVDMLKVADEMDQIGFHSLEVWGGATFDACLRFLSEDPWERLRKLKRRFVKTPLQMLLRGQNLLGYRHYPDDVVEAFVKKAVENGIDIIRIFDALNDTRNMEVAIKATKAAGAHAQGTVVYTISPVHGVDHYLKTARTLVEMGADSICIKDMAGILTPYAAEELVRALKRELDVPVQLHTHYTSGMAAMMYLKGIEAGADVIDTSLSVLAMGSSQPATETMVAALAGTRYDTGIDLKALTRVNDMLKAEMGKYSEYLTPLSVDTQVLIYQIPGGMISNLASQLKQQGMLDKLEEVLAEVPRVRADMGYPPLVTPMSQIVGTQAVFNVATGQRYLIKSKEIKDYVKGLYGEPPAPISEEIKKLILGDEEPIKGRYADQLEPRMDSARQELKEKGYYWQEEDVLTYVLFPEPAIKFFEMRQKAALA